MNKRAITLVCKTIKSAEFALLENEDPIRANMVVPILTMKTANRTQTTSLSRTRYCWSKFATVKAVWSTCTSLASSSGCKPKTQRVVSSAWKTTTSATSSALSRKSWSEVSSTPSRTSGGFFEVYSTRFTCGSSSEGFFTWFKAASNLSNRS